MSLNAINGHSFAFMPLRGRSEETQEQPQIPNQPVALNPFDPLDQDCIAHVLSFSFLDLRDLAQFSLSCHYANSVVNADVIWKAIAIRINFSYKEDRSNKPLYQKVLCFIAKLQCKSSKIAFRPQDITAILKAPAIAEIAPMQRWLTARKQCKRWKEVHQTTVTSRALIFAMNAEGPICGPGTIDRFNNSAGVISLAASYDQWLQRNRDLLTALDTLTAWHKLASKVDRAEPQWHLILNQWFTLQTEEQIVSRARQFDAWFQNHLDTLVSLKEFRLRERGLTSVPVQICTLSNLTTLNLCGNPLTALPDQLSLLTCLEIVDLSYCHLLSLPVQTCTLQQLKTLDLTGNKLSSLPEEIKKLTGLRDLTLWSNKFKSFPEQIFSLTLLESLTLQGNRLTCLSSRIGDFKRLKWLNLSYNCILILPKQIGQLSELENLLLNNNALTELPSQIGMLTKLESLKVTHNHLTNLPVELDNLPQTCEIQYSSNPISPASNVNEDCSIL